MTIEYSKICNYFYATPNDMKQVTSAPKTCIYMNKNNGESKR